MVEQGRRKREFCIDNLLVRVHFIVVIIRRTGLAPWEFELPFPGSLTSNILAERDDASKRTLFTRGDWAWGLGFGVWGLGFGV